MHNNQAIFKFLLEIISVLCKLSTAACLNFTACTALDNEILNCRTHDLFACDDNFSFKISEFDWNATRLSILNSNFKIFRSYRLKTYSRVMVEWKCSLLAEARTSSNIKHKSMIICLLFRSQHWSKWIWNICKLHDCIKWYPIGFSLTSPLTLLMPIEGMPKSECPRGCFQWWYGYHQESNDQ